MNPRRLIFVSLFPAAFCFAQDRGTITGIVSDASGSTVPDATVTAKNTATGLTQTSKSGSDGTYNLPYLPVGMYTVTVEKVGFRTTQAAGVRASVNSTARIDMQLEVGDVLQTIEVAASASLLQTERTDLGQVFNSKTILDLPLSLSGGPRNNLQFVLLMPGVTGDPV